MFINDALAQTATTVAPQASVASTFIQLALIFVIFYFLLIRPQQKKIKQHQMMLDAIKVGDKIITGGGVLATVVKADAEKLEVKIADGMVITVFRATIRDVITDEINEKSDKSKAKESKAKKNK